MTKNRLQELLDRPYPIRVDTIPPEDGGGYSAHLPDFGYEVCSSTGDTVAEALENLETVKREVYQHLLDRNDFDFPQPSDPAYIDHEPKRVLLRLPDKLHERIQNHARATGVSVNSYIVTALTEYSAGEAEDTVLVPKKLLEQLDYFSWPEIQRGPADSSWIRMRKQLADALGWDMCNECDGTGEVATEFRSKDCCLNCYGVGKVKE